MLRVDVLREAADAAAARLAHLSGVSSSSVSKQHFAPRTIRDVSQLSPQGCSARPASTPSAASRRRTRSRTRRAPGKTPKRVFFQNFLVEICTQGHISSSAQNSSHQREALLAREQHAHPPRARRHLHLRRVRVRAFPGTSPFAVMSPFSVQALCVPF